jgi:hypothetical protein
MRILAIAILLTCAVRGAAACSCVPIPDVAGALERSDLVADGTVVAIEDRHVGWRKIKVWFQRRFGSPFPSAFDAGFEIHLKVNQVWKGRVTRETVIYTWRDEAGCGFPFRPGNRYVVYARLGPEDEYEASLCSRTRFQGEDDVAALDRLASSKKF